MAQNAYKIDFNEIKSTILFTDLLKHYGEGEQFAVKNKRLSGPCHFCKNQSSFKVSLEKNHWFCHNPDCDTRGGTILDYVMRRESLTLSKAARKLIEWFPGARSSDSSDDMSASDQNHEPDDPETIVECGVNTPMSFRLKNLDSSHTWFANQSFLKETVEHFGAGFFAGKGVMQNRVVIPHVNLDGEVTGYAGMSPESPYIYDYADGFRCDFELYNAEDAIYSDAFVNEKTLFLVRDYFDVWRLYECGCTNAIAYNGETLSKQQYLILFNLLSLNHRIVWLKDRHTECQSEGARELATHCFLTIVELSDRVSTYSDAKLSGLTITYRGDSDNQ